MKITNENLVYQIILFFLFTRKNWFLVTLLAITLLILSNNYLNFNVDQRLFTSIFGFILSSTLALYIFLYRERKDTNKTYSNKTLQFYSFILAFLTALVSLIFLIFEKSFPSLILISLIIYVANIIISVFYTNVYWITLFKIWVIENSLIGYENRIRDSKSSVFNLIFFALKLEVIFASMFLIIINYRSIELINVFLLLVLFTVFFFLVISRYCMNQKILYLEFLNTKVFTLNTGISFINGRLEKNLEDELIEKIPTYTEKLSNILIGNKSESHQFIEKQLNDDIRVKTLLVSLYKNLLVTYKEIISKLDYDDKMVKTLSKSILQCAPIVTFNGIMFDKKPEVIIQLENEYSKIYNKILPELIKNFSIDYENYKLSFIREYFEISMTDITESNYMNNSHKYESNALIIDNRVLFEFIADDKLRSLIEFSTTVLMKKNYKYNDLPKKYLNNIIMLLIKSIELMHLEIAGYLVKFICNNYSTDEINEVYKNIEKTHDIVKDKSRKDQREISLHTVKDENIFFIHQPSFKYCFYKSLIMIKVYNFDSNKIEIKIPEDNYKRIYKKVSEDSKTMGFGELFSELEYNKIFNK